MRIVDTPKSLIVLCLVLVDCMCGFAITHTSPKWEIIKDGDAIRICAGILEQKLFTSQEHITASHLMVNGAVLNKEDLDQFQVSFWKAFPNAEPKGIGYSSDAGVEQTDAVKNQTDALAVKKKNRSKEQQVIWTDSLRVAKVNFGTVFDDCKVQVSAPGKGINRVTLTFSSNRVLKGVSAAVCYEIYNGHPAIRKWVKFLNQGNQWIKISNLLIEQLHLNKTYTRNTLLTPGTRGINPSIIAFSDTTASVGIICASEIPSKLRHLSTDGTGGYNTGFFEWVIGPGESFESEPLFLYAFSGESYPTVSSLSTALDRCVESGFHSFLKGRILRPVSQSKGIAPVFCSWTNYGAAINDENMHASAAVFNWMPVGQIPEKMVDGPFRHQNPIFRILKI